MSTIMFFMIMCIQENCLFLLDMAGTSEAYEVSSTKKWLGEHKISPHKMYIFISIIH